MFVCCIAVQLTTAQVQLTNLPTMYISTDGGRDVVEKDVYLNGKISVKSAVAAEEITNVATQIKGRGNSTWDMPKKPYRLKLDKKANIFGLPANEKNWILLANFADKTLMRNAVAFKISELVGLEFTPSVKFVDVVFNNKYIGNYMLTDQVEVAEHRVEIEEQEQTDTSEPALSGGYLLEIDGFADEELKWFLTPRALEVTVKYPKDDEINDAQMAYITNWTNNFENVLFSSDFKDPVKGYRLLVDTATLINWYIACELTGNSDSFWSTYIYKRRNVNKLFFGPLWDYDIAFNNDDRLGDAVNKLMRDAAHQPLTWIQRFCQDEWFQQAVERRWKTLVDSGIEAKIVTFINETETLLQASQQKNYQSWNEYLGINTLYTKVYREYRLFNTYEGGVDFLRQYIQDRIVFLTQRFVPIQEYPTVPFVADSFYYRIVNKRSNNAIDHDNDDSTVNSNLVLWSPSDQDDGQLWQIDSLGDGLFRFTNKKSRLIMTANGWSKNLIQAEARANNDGQKWEIVPLFNGGIYGILNPTSGYSLNNSNGGFDNGTPVIEYDNNMTLEEKLNQHWYLNKVEAIEPMANLVYPSLPTKSFTCHAANQVIYYKDLPNGSTLKVFDLQGIKKFNSVTLANSGNIHLNLHGLYVLTVLTPQGTYSLLIVL
jgi:hypothetical protein